MKSPRITPWLVVALVPGLAVGAVATSAGAQIGVGSRGSWSVTRGVDASASIPGSGAPGAPATAAPRSFSSTSSANLAYTPLSTPVRIADTRPGYSDPSTYAGDTLTSGGEQLVDLPVSAGVPVDAGAVVVEITAVGPSGPGYLTVYPSGGSLPTVANVNFTAGQTVGNLATVGLGTDTGTGSDQSFTVYLGPSSAFLRSDFTADLEGYYAPETSSSGAAYVPLSPVRIWDSRSGSGEPGAGSALGPGGSDSVPVTGSDGVPSSASAVVLNVAVTNPTMPSYITAYPTGASPPDTATQNFLPGETLASEVVAGVGLGGGVTITNYAGSVDIVVDLDGYFSAPGASGSLFTPLSTPTRLLDTRPSTLRGGASTLVGIPQSSASAAVLNVTDVYEGYGPGNYLTVYPAGGSAPLASNVNYVLADGYQVVPNSTYVTVGTGGGTEVVNGPGGAGPAAVVVDEFGYFTPAPPPLSVTTASLPRAVAGSAYLTTLSASGGTAPYSWSLASGSPPSGLTLSSSGTISGTPSSQGTSSFTVEVSDSASPPDTATQALSITVGASPLAITTGSLPQAAEGSSYSTSLAASGGTPPYSWSLAGGSLPAGLGLSTSGTISGTPTAPGTSSFTVEVTDSASPSGTATQTLSMAVSPSTLVIVTTVLPEAAQNPNPSSAVDSYDNYVATLDASGGTQPYTWQLAGGTLPAGLSLSPSGQISGIPEKSGTFSFELEVSDSTSPPQSATQSLTLDVPPLDSPNWSGWVEYGTNVTAVRGTFSVPQLTGNANPSEQTAVWVGVDGYDNDFLIQSGISEYEDPTDPGLVIVEPWWTTQAQDFEPQPITSLSVSPGDELTVVIGQVSGEEWSISLTDDTTGQQYERVQPYGGPMDSAEWIVEAPGASTNNPPVPLAPYTPPVSFSAIGLTISQDDGLVQLDILQDGSLVSIPSAFDSAGDGFTVMYDPPSS